MTSSTDIASAAISETTALSCALVPISSLGRLRSEGNIDCLPYFVFAT